MINRWWLYIKRHFNGLYLVSFAFIVAGIVLFLLPSLKDTAWLQALAGALLGTGLTITVTTMTANQSIQEQYKKEANLQRKTYVYGPLHAELKTLRERLEEVKIEEEPYPQFIDISGGKAQLPLRQTGLIQPSLTLWPEFRKDYRIDDFTPNAQKMLDNVHKLGDTYNQAVHDVQKTMQDILRKYIAAEVLKIEKHHHYQEWQQRRKQPPYQQHAWFEFIERIIQFSDAANKPLAEDVSRSWSITIGWLLADKADKAAEEIYNHDIRNMGALDLISEDWFRNIFRATMRELEKNHTYFVAYKAIQFLTIGLREAENILYQGLLDIRNRYEGGTPPV